MKLPQWTQLPDLGLYMDQVITLMERTFFPGEMTKSMVNNYVKAGLVKRPAGKKYDREQLAQLIMIGVFKQALRLEDTARLLALLCRSGTQAGYERFCHAACMLDNAIETGSMGQTGFGGSQTQEERAIMAGITAAVCAARTRSMLDALHEEKGT